MQQRSEMGVRYRAVRPGKYYNNLLCIYQSRPKFRDLVFLVQRFRRFTFVFNIRDNRLMRTKPLPTDKTLLETPEVFKPLMQFDFLFICTCNRRFAIHERN